MTRMDLMQGFIWLMDPKSFFEFNYIFLLICGGGWYQFLELLLKW